MKEIIKCLWKFCDESTKYFFVINSWFPFLKHWQQAMLCTATFSESHWYLEWDCSKDSKLSLSNNLSYILKIFAKILMSRYWFFNFLNLFYALELYLLVLILMGKLIEKYYHSDFQKWNPQRCLSFLWLI